MGKKINFPLRFLYVNFKILSKFSNLNLFFAQTRKNLQLGFLISFRIIKDFQNSLKLAFSSQNSLKIHKNFQNVAGFQRFFRLRF